MFLETGIGPGLKALKGWSIIHSVTMDGKRDMLRHFLGAIAYRTQKALRAAPSGFGEFEPGGGVRSPRELLRHMRSVLGYARTFFIGGSYSPEVLPTLQDEIAEFHKMLEDLRDHFNKGTPLTGITEEQMLQGPFADVMTHAGQLALLGDCTAILSDPRILFMQKFLLKMYRPTSRILRHRMNIGRRGRRGTESAAVAAAGLGFLRRIVS